MSTWRGLVAASTCETLAAVNAVDGVTVFTVPDGLPVDCGADARRREDHPARHRRDIGRRSRASRGERADGVAVVAVRPFLPLRVAAIVRQHLTDDARSRFERSLAMRSAWFGGAVERVRYVDDRRGARARRRWSTAA